MKIGAITNMYPTAAMSAQGTFVASQVAGLRQIGLEVCVLHIPRVGGGRLVYASLFGTVRRFVRDVRPDLIHVMYGGPLACIAVSAAGGTPAVVSFCGSDLLGEPGYSGWRRWMGDCVVRTSHMAARRADGIIVKSTELRRALPKGAPAGRVWVIPNGVDLDRFQPLDRRRCRRDLGWKETGFMVLFAGSPSNPTKRFPLAQAAVETLRAEGVPVSLKVMAGVAHDAVPLWLNAADALLLCSLHEGSPNIVKEALACNRPVVAVDVGDVQERIEGIAGCHLAAAEPEDLAAKLRLVYEGPGNVDGRTRMRDLSILSVAERVGEVYQVVLNLPRTAAA
jgi:glycosyltransferase involved in cell wall biosynthesis